MAKQNINVGATANDRSGDSLRSAFQKINSNFTELYTALGLNADTNLNLGAFEFTGSTMSTTDSSSIVIDQSTTISSNLTVGGDILPYLANGGNLGSSSNPWHSLYVSNNTIYIGGNAISIDGNGELTLNNNRIVQENGEYLTLDNLIDVNANSPLPGETIVWNGGAWVNGQASASDRLSNAGDEVVLVGGANPYVTFPAITGGDQIQISGAEISALSGNFALTGQTNITIITNAAGVGGGSNYFTFDANGTLTFPDGTSQSTAGANLGNLRVNSSAGGTTIGTVDNPNTGGWGGYDLYIDSGNNSDAKIYIPSVSNQAANMPLQIHNNALATSIIQLFGRGGVQVITNNGVNEKVFEFADNGTLIFPDGSLALTDSVLANGLDADIKGSVFGDDSTILVDGVSGVLRANVNVPNTWTVTTGDKTWSFIYGDVSEGTNPIFEFPGSLQAVGSQTAIYAPADDLSGNWGMSIDAANSPYYVDIGEISGSNYWRFGGDGRLYLPSIGGGGGAILRSPLNESIGLSAYNDTGAGATYTLSVATTGPINIPTASTGLGRLQNPDGIEILTNSGASAKLFTFANDGTLITNADTTIRPPESTSTAGNPLTVRAGDSETQVGGNLILRGGDTIGNVGTPRNSGYAVLRAGSTVTGNGGYAELLGGNTTAGDGGQAYVTAGSATTGNGGPVEIRAGTTVTGDGGSVIIESGEAVTGTAGNIDITAKGTVTGDGGNVNLAGGSAISGNGGAINLTAGDTVGSGDPGTIRLRTFNAAAPQDWTFNFNGTLTFPDATTQSTAYTGTVNLATVARNIENEGDVNIRVNLTDSTTRIWRFGEDGDLAFPDGTVQTTAFTGTGDITFSSGRIIGASTLGLITFTKGLQINPPNANTGLTIDTTVYTGNHTAFQISSSPGGPEVVKFRISRDGEITFPDATVQTTAFTTSPTLNVLKIDDGVHEKFQTKSSATGVVTHDCSLGHVFYHLPPSANWTVNLTNLNLAVGYATAVTLVIEQGATGYYPSAVQVDGNAVPLAWQGNTTPTPSSNRFDVVTFSILYDGLYTVLGQLTGF